MTHHAKKTDRYIPYYFVAFFLVIFIVLGTFTYLALSTHRGVVTDNAYQKGLEYNQTIASEEAQKLLGWSSTIQLDSDTLIFALSDANGNSIKGAKVIAYASRPTQAGHDIQVVLTPKGANYTSQLNLPFKGQWDIKVLATWKQQPYQTSKRIILK